MSQKNKRVFIGGLHQESNSFNPVLATKNKFDVLNGEEIINADIKRFSTVGGMLSVFKEADVELIGGVYMRSGSGGPVDGKTVDEFIETTLCGLKKAGKIDGVILSMHGATMSDKSDDVCGDIVAAIRETLGQDAVISVSFDLHANVTEKIAKNADYISGYQTYPHLDLFETGVRAAKRLVEHFTRGRAYLSRAEIPVIAPAHAYTTTKGRLGKLMDRAKDMVKAGVITDFSVFQVQPWLDAQKMAATVIIISNDKQSAIDAANTLAKEEFALRKELQGEPLKTVDQVIEAALNNKTGKPVVLVDSADSPNAGANSDSAAVLEYLLPVKDKLKCVLSVTDKAAVDKAFALGVGGVGDFTLGASIAPKLTKPVTVKGAMVKSLHDGEFLMYGPQERGRSINIGKTAILQVGKIYIHVCYDGRCEGDRAYYSSFGVEPELCDLVCVKACTSFRAGYESISAEIHNAETPGAAGTVLQNLPYEKRQKPLYPFEEITEDMILKAKIYR